LSATEVGSEPAAPEREESARLLASAGAVTLRRVAVAAWVVAVAIWTAREGVAVDRTQLLVIICSGLIAASVGRRRALMVLRDWLPFAAVLFVYDLSRGAASLLGRHTEWHLQITFDRWLFRVEPTVWLQSELKQPFAPWWEVGVSMVYVSFFIAPYAVAGVLWLRNRNEWRRFVLRFVAVSFIGLAGFIAIPAAPPWAAAQCTAAEVASGPADPGCLYSQPGSAATGGLLGEVHPVNAGAAAYIERISNRGWDRLGLQKAQALVNEGQASVNLVAAVPSLHAAISALLAVVLWPLVRRRWRPLVVAYPIVMAFALVYSAEHYVFDILMGWLVTAVVCVGFSYLERRLRARRAVRMAAGDTALDTDTLEGPLLTRT
jgi:membrane-associated phospholipid phosphatase